MGAVEIGAKVYGRCAVGVLVGCVATTYALYVLEGGAPLPSIAETWVNPPGSYVSRFLVSFAVVMLVFIQFMLQQHVALGMLGATCLSWVVAVCDDDDDDSGILRRLRRALATAFFVAYDVQILLSREYWILAASVAAKVVVVAADWIDAACVVSWLALRTSSKALEDVYWRFGDTVSTPIATINGVTAMRCTVLLYLGTLAVTAAIGLAHGYLPTRPGRLWWISDMWASAPGTWISRWAVPLGAHLGWFTLGALFVAEGNKGSPRRRSATP